MVAISPYPNCLYFISMFLILSIHEIFLESSRSGSVTVLSADTDVLESLLFHLNDTWPGFELLLMRNGSAINVAGEKQWEVVHLQDIFTHFSSSVINQLLAGHTLTGSDTVANVGKKRSDTQASDSR